MKLDLYSMVTNQIISALEAGTAPWVCPWKHSPGSYLPANLSTGRPYRGINVVLLNMQAIALGYTSNRWITFNQARAMGGSVRRGETGTTIVFFKIMEVAGHDDKPRAANDEPGRRVIPLLRSFTVFNAAQLEGLPDADSSPLEPSAPWSAVGAAEALLSRSGAVLRHGGNRAFYRPADDVIQMPHMGAFDQAEPYYATALHELTHWTGHPSRCNRVQSGRQHIEAYAFEELVAELGAAFLCSYCGIAGQLQHASYIESWLHALRNDKRLIFSAASLAQKAADFLLPPVEAEAPVSTATGEVAA